MADNRELTFGMDFGLDDAINRLGETIDRLEQIVDRAQDVEDAAQDMGARVRAGTDAIRDGARMAERKPSRLMASSLVYGEIGRAHV